jgi:hypothetical protein
LFVFVACSKKNLTTTFTPNEIVKSFYIVDTIKIENAIGFIYVEDSYNATFYIDQEKLGQVKDKSIEEIIENPNVFLASTYFFDYFKNSDDLNGLESCMDIKREKFSENIVLFRHVNEVEDFIMMLVNIGYYNKNESSMNYLPINDNLNSSAYLKVLVPICSN